MKKSINEKEQCVQTDVKQSVLFEDDLVTYETALLAREKGFDIDCGWKLKKLDDGTFTHTNCSDLGVEQPTQSLLQKWLREVKGENIIPPLFFSYQGYACDTYDCGWTMGTVWWYEDKQCWMTTGAVESTEAHLPYTYWRKLPPFPNEV